jgi:hypothetical protein
MDTALHSTRFSLWKDGLIALRDGQNTRVDCLQGSVWVTQEGTIKDEILEAGESLVVRQPGLTLITALIPAIVAFAEPAGASRRERPQALARRGLRWLGLHHGTADA